MCEVCETITKARELVSQQAQKYEFDVREARYSFGGKTFTYDTIPWDDVAAGGLLLIQHKNIPVPKNHGFQSFESLLEQVLGDIAPVTSAGERPTVTPVSPETVNAHYVEEFSQHMLERLSGINKTLATPFSGPEWRFIEGLLTRARDGAKSHLRGLGMTNEQ